MPNVSRGSRMQGLLAYLAGPGRANEHAFPHLVAGDGMLMSWFGGEDLSGADAQMVARHLDAPAVRGEVEVAGGHVWHCSLSLASSEGQLEDAQWAQIAQDFMAEMGWRAPCAVPVSRGVMVGDEAKAGNAAEGVGQGAAESGAASLSVVAGEASSGSAVGAGAGDVAGDVPGDAGRARPAVLRWVAVRHGLSKNGNDHVHLVVNLVTEEGAVAGTFNDFRRAQAASRALEKKHGLVQLASATRGVASRGWKPAELEAAARRTAMAGVESARRSGAASIGWAEMDGATRKAAVAAAKATAAGPLGAGLGEAQPRRVLEIAVRGAATAARTEADFVRRLREAGVLVRPRYAEGSLEQVVGFSVALRPQFGARHGERPVWFGGGRLARDLTLPRLRGGWQHDEAAAASAAGEWAAAVQGRRCVTPPSQRRERRVFTDAHAVAHSRKVAAMSQRLAQVPAGQRPLWAKVAGSSAGTLSAWAVEAARSSDADTAALAPMLASAAQVLSRSAQTVNATPSSFEAGTTSMSGVAMLLASAARGGLGAVGQAVLVAQMIALVEAVAQMAAARRELDLTRDLRVQVTGRLQVVEQVLRGRAGVAGVAAGVPVGTPMGVPMGVSGAAARLIPHAVPQAGSAQVGAGRGSTTGGAGGDAANAVGGARTASADPGWVAAWGAHLEALHKRQARDASARPVAGPVPGAAPAAAPGDGSARTPSSPSSPTSQGAKAAAQPTSRSAAKPAVESTVESTAEPTVRPGTGKDEAALKRERATRRAAEREADAEAQRRRRTSQPGDRDRGGPTR